MSTGNVPTEEQSEFAATNGRMALTFIPVLPSEDARSFVGGYPRLPAGMDWPRDGSSELMFLAQIELADLPWLPDGWPAGGTLYFFHNPKLEDADHSKVAISRAKDGTEYPSKFVYFASQGQKLVTAKPKEPHTRKTFFQYAGDGCYHYGKPIGPRLERTYLPHAALHFAPYTQYYAGAWFNAKHDASGLEFTKAWDQYGEAFSRLKETLTEKEKDEKNQAFSELGAPWLLRESDEESRRRIYGGAPHIDVGGLLQKLPEERAFNQIRKQTNIDPRYTSWPESGGMVMHHAVSVANSVNVGSTKNEPLSQLAKRYVKEANEWAEWGHQHAYDLLSGDMRDEYLNWARSAFQRTLKVYENSWRLMPLRKYLVAPFGKSKGISRSASQALKIAQSLVLLSDAREFGLRVLTPLQISKMPDDAQHGYLSGVFRGQLFGWGGELQTEVKDNAEHLCLAVFYGNRDISFEADFKIWLAQPLQSDAWQPVRVVNAIN